MSDMNESKKMKQDLLYAKKFLKEADPIFVKSSPQYKELRNAMDAFAKKGAMLFSQKDSERLSVETACELISLADITEENATEYKTYKENAIENRDPNALENRRMEAAAMAGITAKEVKKRVREVLLNSTKNFSEEEKLNAVEQTVWNTGKFGPRKMAEMIYLQSLRVSLGEKKQNAPGMADALNHETMNANVDKIMNHEAFREMASRFVAQDMRGEKLQANLYRKFVEYQKQADGIKHSLEKEPRAPISTNFNTRRK